MVENQHNLESCFVCQNKSKCFRQLSDKELEKSNSHKVKVEFKKGETIIKQGSFSNHVFFIKKGLVKLQIEIPTSIQNLGINVLPQGNIIGLPSIYDNGIYTYTATAIEDSTICMIENNIIHQLIENNGKFAAELIKAINTCSASVFNRFVSASKKQLRSRIADLLIYLASDVYKSNNFQLTLSSNDIAELTSMSKASAVKILKEFRNDNVISINRGYFEIINKDELEHISELF